MNHYISVCVPLEAGRWRVSLPDVPGCEAEGDSLEEAMMRAGDALTQHAVALNGNKPAIPLPCDLVRRKLDICARSRLVHGCRYNDAAPLLDPAEALEIAA